jgi:hypothetical protein
VTKETYVCWSTVSLEEKARRETAKEVYAQERQREINETFEPWHKDPVRIARLLRFLELLDKTPVDMPAFIESAATWQADYDDLMTWTDRE